MRAVVVGSRTDVDVVLRRRACSAGPRTGAAPVTEVRLFADDARGLLARLRDGPGRPADASQEAR